MPTQNQDQSKKNLGLDDPKRVRRVLDRGHSFFPQQGDHNKAVNGVPDNIPDQCDFGSILCEELQSALVTCGLEQTKRFLPHNKLKDILPFHRVRRLVQELKCFQDASDKKTLAKEICYGTQDRPPSLKLLAALICIDSQEDISMHMAEGLNDSCFPLSLHPSGQRQLIHCKVHPKGHTAINKPRRAMKREMLSIWSYRLSSPFILKKQGIHSHYVLDAGDVFPILPYHDTPHDTSHTGGFSTVHKVQLHPSHFALEGPSEWHKKRKVRYMSVHNVLLVINMTLDNPS